jgi:hypothetical protein
MENPIQFRGFNAIEALRFFHFYLDEYLEAEVLPDGADRVQDAWYLSSVLAHYTMTSSHSDSGFPLQLDIPGLFDTFVLPTRVGTYELSHFSSSDPLILEEAGAQLIFHNGFFRQYVIAKRPGAVRFYDGVGKNIFRRAAECEPLEERKRHLFDRLSRHLPFWNHVLSRMNRQMADDAMSVRYLIKS